MGITLCFPFYTLFNPFFSSFSLYSSQEITYKVRENETIFIVLLVDDILLASNDFGMLHKTKHSIPQNCMMNDFSEASYANQHGDSHTNTSKRSLEPY